MLHSLTMVSLLKGILSLEWKQCAFHLLKHYANQELPKLLGFVTKRQLAFVMQCNNGRVYLDF